MTICPRYKQVIIITCLARLNYINFVKNISTAINILDKEICKYNVPVVDLIKIQSNDSFKIFVSAFLSARTNDKTTVKVCEGLFSKEESFKKIRKISVSKLEKLIYPVGFYKVKAKNVLKMFLKKPVKH